MSVQQIELLQKIRKMKEAKSLTYQQIVDACISRWRTNQPEYRP